MRRLFRGGPPAPTEGAAGDAAAMVPRMFDTVFASDDVYTLRASEVGRAPWRIGRPFGTMAGSSAALRLARCIDGGARRPQASAILQGAAPMQRRALLALLPATLVLPSIVLAHPHEMLTRERQGAIEQQVMATRDGIRAAVAARDAARLRTLYAADFTHTHATGKVDGRDARIVALLAGEPTVELARVEELTIRVLHADTAILTGRSPVQRSDGGGTRDVRWMQVYVRADGDWRLAASQATGLSPTT